MRAAHNPVNNATWFLETSAFSLFCAVKMYLVWHVSCCYQPRKLATALTALISESFDYILCPQWELKPGLQKFFIHLATYVQG